MPVFVCQECGECCYGYGGTYVSHDDIKRIADYISADPDTFIEKYCVPSGKKWVLRQRSDGFCVFEKEKLCGIHPVKPNMCWSWPHIKSVLMDIQNWQIMGGFCPGIDRNAPQEDVRREVMEEMKKRGEEVPEDLE